MQGQCRYVDGTYKLDWYIDGGDIVFNLEDQVPMNSWSGVGFGPKMVGQHLFADAYTCLLYTESIGLSASVRRRIGQRVGGRQNDHRLHGLVCAGGCGKHGVAPIQLVS
jgi:hypothetical protein